MSGIVRFDPFRDLDALQRQFFGDDLVTQLKGISFPTTDVYTKDNKELIVEAHLPRFEKDDVEISIDNGSLIIQAEKHEKEEDKKRKYVVRESSSSFYRRIQLPDRANTEKIDARLDDGVLKVVVPLVELPQPKKIAISSKNKELKK